MFTKIFVWCFLLRVVIGQFNGDFWWMNSKLANYRSDLTEPKFEKLSEFDTDESDKIIFRDSELFSDDADVKKQPKSDKSIKNTNEEWKIDIDFQDKSALSWPVDMKENIFDTSTKEPKRETILENHKVNEKNESQSTNDILEFIFPETENIIWKDKTDMPSTSVTKKNTTKNEIRKPNTLVFVTDKTPVTEMTTDKIVFETNKPNKCDSIDSKKSNKVQIEDTETESICTFMKKVECNRINGIVYLKRERASQRPLLETQSVCCILPLSKADQSARIHFRDFSTMTKRYKRADTETINLTPAMKQRNSLLLRNFVFPSHKTKPSPSPQTTNLKKKIVTFDDDYVDPYLNIKNSNFRTPKPQNHPNKQTSIKSEYSDDYVEDYVVELPTPGLVGLYSDYGTRPQKPGWTFSNDNTGKAPYGGAIESEEDGGTSFGYGPTIDPRLVDRIAATTSGPFLGRPVRLFSTTLDDHFYNAESHTISYQSNPDFQVLQGFKLLNLVRDKSRIYRTGKKTTTTESIVENDSEESVLTASFGDKDSYGGSDEDIQLFRDCGRTVKSSEGDYDTDKQIGETGKGSHPWLGIVVLTKKRQSILCYATLVHPRAAVTSADCVYGRTSPGEISFIAGAWDLSDESHEGWQKRTASTHIHSQYRPGELSHNLAILNWKQPLRLTANVQPVCLADPHVGDDCKFHGWGGYDQAIRLHSRWQRASILTPRACDEQLTSNKQESLPEDAFCASVHSRGTVTGTGGPLTCTTGTRQTAVGIAVWRDRVLVMSPIHEWTMASLKQRILH